MVSILLPVYNVAEYLPKCIDSILSQTYHNLQIVLIDDGSQDNSWDICQKYAQQDKRIEIYHQNNQGVAVVRNKLLSYAKGDYTLFVDSDDWIEPNMIKELLNLAIQYDADIINCRNTINDEREKEDHNLLIWTQEEAIYHFLQHIIFRGFLWNKLIRTKLLYGEKFPQDISYGEDAFMCWAILQKVNKVIFTNLKLYHHRINQDSLSFESFGTKKMSAHLVWEKISNEAIVSWPKYSNIANARYCIEMTLLLRDACLSNYKYDDSIKKLQLLIRKNNNLINITRMSSWKMFFYSVIAGRSYKVLKLITRYISH